MARIRTVKPDFWADETTATLSRDARLLFIATFNMADDEGLLRWNAAYLKAEAFMYDDLTVADVQALAKEISDADMVMPYKGPGNQQLGWIVNFHRHQRINRPQPSKISPPSLQNPQVAARYAVRDQWTCHLCGGPVNQQRYVMLDPYSPTEGPDLSSLNPSVDHKKPRAEGGTDHPSNIALAHVGCNKGRGKRPVESFKVPASVERALSYVLTSDDADSLIEIDVFSEDAVNTHDEGTAPSLTEGNGREEEGKGEEAPARKRATSLPADWTPTQEHIDRASQEGIDLNREVVKFRAWAEEGNTSKSWNGRFTRWLIQAAEYQQQRGGRPANISTLPRRNVGVDQWLA